MANYWQAMMDRQYETSYAFMDPFFRDSRSLQNYRDMMGIVQYHSFELGRVIQKGNIAKVEIKVEGSVPEFTGPSGKKISQPRKPMSFVDTWLFVNDDWYREYYDGVSEVSLTRY